MTNTNLTTETATPHIVDFDALARDLALAETTKLALATLVDYIDWTKVKPDSIAHAIQVLSEDINIGQDVEAWARHEHADMCSCCRNRAKAVQS